VYVINYSYPWMEPPLFLSLIGKSKESISLEVFTLS